MVGVYIREEGIDEREVVNWKINKLGDLLCNAPTASLIDMDGNSGDRDGK